MTREATYTHDCGCRMFLEPFPRIEFCHFHRHHRTRRVVMSTQLAPGASAGFHATAYLDLADTQIDPNATVTWRTPDPAVATLTANPSVAGVGSCTVTGVAPGTTSLISVATDADGKSVDSVAWPITVAVPVPDAVAVVITQDPVVAPPAA